jgi:hypothetical protein
MAGVKDATTAAEITTRSKHARMHRLQKLFSIRNLKDLFPEGATPNGAEYLYLNCSGDVLRDLCQIGEHLKMRRMTPPAARLRVRRAFKAGQIATHQDIKNLLKALRDNEVESAMKAHIIKHEDEDMDLDEASANQDGNPSTVGGSFVGDSSFLGHGSFAKGSWNTNQGAKEQDAKEQETTGGSAYDSDVSAPLLVSVSRPREHKPSTHRLSHTLRTAEDEPPTKYSDLIEKNTRLSSALLFAQSQFRAIEAKIATGEPVLAVDAIIGVQLAEQVLEENKI